MIRDQVSSCWYNIACQVIIHILWMWCLSTTYQWWADIGLKQNSFTLLHFWKKSDFNKHKWIKSKSNTFVKQLMIPCFLVRLVRYQGGYTNHIFWSGGKIICDNIVVQQWYSEGAVCVSAPNKQRNCSLNHTSIFFPDQQPASIWVVFKPFFTGLLNAKGKANKREMDVSWKPQLQLILCSCSRNLLSEITLTATFGK